LAPLGILLNDIVPRLLRALLLMGPPLETDDPALIAFVAALEERAAHGKAAWSNPEPGRGLVGAVVGLSAVFQQHSTSRKDLQYWFQQHTFRCTRMMRVPEARHPSHRPLMPSDVGAS
jgi:hypothetical protein